MMARPFNSDPVAFELLAMIVELEMTDEVKSLFQVATICLLEYSWGWRLLGLLEEQRYVTVERNGRGVPLKIASTEQGRKALAERCEERAEGVLGGI
ncbi:MAG TPA: hypothetical protein VIK33_17495 [Anaerolineae bacterium]